ncbi:hypothetical protein N7470_000880 [Penicillium chermesinum]|nr:hypothetical protein N7470_000880 [Penicillium chermesinum]
MAKQQAGKFAGIPTHTAIPDTLSPSGTVILSAPDRIPAKEEQERHKVSTLQKNSIVDIKLNTDKIWGVPRTSTSSRTSKRARYRLNKKPRAAAV